jgi:Flp pilus assembly protein TadB
LVKIIGGIIAAGAATFATFKALAEWRRSTEQRAEELKQRVEELKLRRREFRHKQALFARDLISEVFRDPKSPAALRMLDWEEFDYEDETGKTYKVSQTEIKRSNESQSRR